MFLFSKEYDDDTFQFLNYSATQNVISAMQAELIKLVSNILYFNRHVRFARKMTTWNTVGESASQIH